MINTGTEELLAEINDGIGLITLNRPQARNAMSGEMTRALKETLADFELNPAVKCLVLTGAGKGFCAGGDVKGMAASGDGTVGDNTIDGAIHGQRIYQRATAGKLFRMPKPAIAALPGAAAGAARGGGVGRGGTPRGWRSGPCRPVSLRGAAAPCCRASTARPASPRRR